MTTPSKDPPSLVPRCNQMIIGKVADQLIVAGYDKGALIVFGWTVSIGLDDLKEYVATFGQNSGRQVERGFFFHEGKFVISHSGAKLTLTPEEGTAVVSFLSDYYGLS